MSEPLPTTRVHKGRGAASNPEGRFEHTRHQAEDDGWLHEVEDVPRPADRASHAAIIVTA